MYMYTQLINGEREIATYACVVQYYKTNDCRVPPFTFGCTSAK